MWIFTETGFVSVVRHFSDEEKLVVRARDHKSLEGLANSFGLEIVSTPSNDYPYRVFVADSVFASWLSEQTMAVDYTNFKNRVHDSRGHDFAGALMSVWTAMHDVEDSEARG